MQRKSTSGTTPAEALVCQRHNRSGSSLTELIASALPFTPMVLAMQLVGSGLITGRTVGATFSRREIVSISALARTPWALDQLKGRNEVSVPSTSILSMELSSLKQLLTASQQWFMGSPYFFTLELFMREVRNILMGRIGPESIVPRDHRDLLA